MFVAADASLGLLLTKDKALQGDCTTCCCCLMAVLTAAASWWWVFVTDRPSGASIIEASATKGSTTRGVRAHLMALRGLLLSFVLGALAAHVCCSFLCLGLLCCCCNCCF